MNAIADKHNRSATPYKGEGIPSDLTPNPKVVFKRKITCAFHYFDTDNSDSIDLEEFRNIMSLIKAHVNDSDLINIFKFVDVDSSGSIELPELVNFLEIPFDPPEVIRCTMSNHLSTPWHFLEYHKLNVTTRSHSLKLVPGPDGLAAYFNSSTDSAVNNVIQPGFRLTFINTTRVDSKTFVDIQRRLEIAPLPYILVFQHEDVIRQVKIQDSSGKFHTLNYNPAKGEPTSKEKEMFNGPVMEMVNPGRDTEESKKEIYEFFGHCRHCPRDSVWWLKIHLFMEDENFSKPANFLTYFIMLLIAISTFTYVFQTLPDWEYWPGWQVMEGIVSIVFSVEFLVRIASSRSISRYLSDTMNIIDFCAIIPFWIEVFTAGKLDPELLRIVRVIRLLRLFRLARAGSMQEILTIYSLTAKDVFHWLIIFLMIGGVVLICIASFEYIFELGVVANIGVCDISSGTVCEDTPNNVFYDGFSTTFRSALSCESACENFALSGCCAFNQVVGNCHLSNSTEIVTLNSSSYNSGLCGITSRQLRIDGDETPYYAITNSFWWACVTMFMVGYGEVYPITEPGRLISAVAAALGLMFLAVPVIIVGFHFLLSLVTVRYRNLPASVDKELEATNRGSVMQLLEQVNTEVGTRIFKQEDIVVFLLYNIRLNSKDKLEQILCYPNGWSYLPFAYDWTPGLPRLTQFKLFILFGVYGRRFQNYRSAQKKQKLEFFQSLSNLEKENELVSPNEAGNPLSRESKIRRNRSRSEPSRNYSTTGMAGIPVSQSRSSIAFKFREVPNIPITTTYCETSLMKNYSNPLKLGDFCDTQINPISLPYVVHEKPNMLGRKNFPDNPTLPRTSDGISSPSVMRVVNKKEESIILLPPEKSLETSMEYEGFKLGKTNVRKPLVENYSDSVEEFSQITTQL